MNDDEHDSLLKRLDSHLSGNEVGSSTKIKRIVKDGSIEFAHVYKFNCCTIDANQIRAVLSCSFLM